MPFATLHPFLISAHSFSAKCMLAGRVLLLQALIMTGISFLFVPLLYMPTFSGVQLGIKQGLGVLEETKRHVLISNAS